MGTSEPMGQPEKNNDILQKTTCTILSGLDGNNPKVLEHAANATCFAPYYVHTHQVDTLELIINFLFRVHPHLQWIKEREINMFCVILLYYAHNVVSYSVRERYSRF